MAARLSEDGTKTVALLEAGVDTLNENFIAYIPGMDNVGIGSNPLCVSHSYPAPSVTHRSSVTLSHMTGKYPLFPKQAEPTALSITLAERVLVGHRNVTLVCLTRRINQNGD